MQLAESGGTPPDASMGVIIPLFQGEPFIEAALASVATQSQQPTEVVVVDDGSEDRGADLALEWRDLLPLRVIRHPTNRGLPAALRTGIATLSTNLIAQLDADDIWLPDHLEQMGEAYRRRPGLISADALRWIPGRALSRRSWSDRYALPPAQDQLVALAKDNWIFGATLFHRDDYDRAGGYLDRPSCEDWDLWLRMVRSGVVVSRPRYPTMLYRLRPGTLSRGEKLYLAQMEILTDFIEQTSSIDVQAAAECALSNVERQLHLLRSYEYARAGDAAGGRREARSAMGPISPTTFRAFAMVANPVLSVKLYDFISRHPQWQVNR